MSRFGGGAGLLPTAYGPPDRIAPRPSARKLRASLISGFSSDPDAKRFVRGSLGVNVSEGSFVSIFSRGEQGLAQSRGKMANHGKTEKYYIILDCEL